jgi:hypothetical protein
MQKATLHTLAQSGFESVTTFSEQTALTSFYTSNETGKWSAAENLIHLNLAMKRSNLAMRLPKFMVRLVSGKANRPSRTYDELVQKYQAKLNAGAAASSAFIPQLQDKSKSLLIKNWQELTNDFLRYLEDNWTEEQLDSYLVPHPILGKITVRELCYFTIFHTAHHLEIMKKRVK